MKKIKSLLLLALAVSTLSLNAREVEYYTDGVTPSVEPAQVVFNEEGQATLYFWIDTEVTTLNSFQLDLHLPQGYTIAKNARGKYIVKFTDDEDVIYDHGVSVGDSFVNDEDPFYRLLCSSPNMNYIGTGHNMILYAELQAPEVDTQADGDANDPIELVGRIDNMVFSAEGGWVGYKPAEISFTLVPYVKVNGIESVTTDAVNGMGEEFYNLQGVRLTQHPTEPGIYIIRKGNEISKIAVSGR